jgi:hypothetical protein
MTCRCDLDLRITDLGLVRDKSSWSVWHFCQFILKSLKKWQSYWADTTTSALSKIVTLTCKCDLDLWVTDLDLVSHTSSSCAWHFSQVILKSLKKWQSYWVDTTTSALSGIMTWPVNVILTFMFLTFLAGYLKIPQEMTKILRGHKHHCTMGLWLTFKFDRDLQATNLCLVHDTLSLCVMTFTSKCDLDLWAKDLGPVLVTSSSCVWLFDISARLF